MGNCFKCHAVDKNKKGPALRNIAAKYKGKSDAQETTIAYITTGPMVKVRDGGEESHPVIDTRDPAALQNLADWILSQ